MLALALSACVIDPTPAPPAEPAPVTDAPAQPAGAKNVQLWVFPDDDERLLTDMIAAARQRVYMKMYLLTDARIFDALKQAHDGGVDVKVLIEINPFGGATSARTAFDKLKAAGVPVKTANPAFRLTHEKSFVIDDQAVILTANMTRSSFTRNREFAVVHEARNDVAEIVRAFNADWQREAFEPASPTLVWSPVNARERINGVITGARRTLDVYAASTLDDRQIALLAEAQQRGVTVRLMTSPPRENDSEDAAAGDLDKLQRARVQVRYLKSPIVHAKVFVADAGRSNELAFVGSVNMTTQSMDFNRELGILLADRDAITRILQTYEKDWAKATDR